MKAVELAQLGSFDHLRVVERPDPSPGEGEVVVAIQAAGVSFAEGLIVLGRYQVTPALPFTPGMIGAGVVEAVGSDVDPGLVGERVVAHAPGAWASHMRVDRSRLVRLPASVDCVTAASFAESYATAWFAITERAPVRSGQSVLVLGAGSGVGLAAVDVATHLGARVVACASSEARLVAARAAGAVDAIRYDRDDPPRVLTDVPVDVVVDPVGGAITGAALRALGRFGRYVVVGFAAGAIPDMPANRILLRNRSVIGVDWGDVNRESPLDGRRHLEDVTALVGSGALNPPVPGVYPLADVAGALADLSSGSVIGKLVLVP